MQQAFGHARDVRWIHGNAPSDRPGRVEQLIWSDDEVRAAYLGRANRDGSQYAEVELVGTTTRSGSLDRGERSTVRLRALMPFLARFRHQHQP